MKKEQSCSFGIVKLGFYIHTGISIPCPPFVHGTKVVHAASRRDFCWAFTAYAACAGRAMSKSHWLDILSVQVVLTSLLSGSGTGIFGSAVVFFSMLFYMASEFEETERFIEALCNGSLAFLLATMKAAAVCENHKSGAYAPALGLYREQF